MEPLVSRQLVLISPKNKISDECFYITFLFFPLFSLLLDAQTADQPFSVGSAKPTGTTLESALVRMSTSPWTFSTSPPTVCRRTSTCLTSSQRRCVARNQLMWGTPIAGMEINMESMSWRKRASTWGPVHEWPFSKSHCKGACPSTRVTLFQISACPSTRVTLYQIYIRTLIIMLFFLPCFSYDRDVIKFSRSNQVRNPEVRVCLSRRQFAHEIKLLRYITKELNAVTGICSSDDEDCLEVVDTTMYYNLDAIDLSLVEVAETTASPGDDIEGRRIPSRQRCRRLLCGAFHSRHPQDRWRRDRGWCQDRGCKRAKRQRWWKGSILAVKFVYCCTDCHSTCMGAPHVIIDSSHHSSLSVCLFVWSTTTAHSPSPLSSLSSVYGFPLSSSIFPSFTCLAVCGIGKVEKECSTMLTILDH